MFRNIRRRPRAFFERTPSGREQIVLERRHSHSGYHVPENFRDDDDDEIDVGHSDQMRRILGENYALQNELHRLRADNQRLLRDNQTLTRQAHDLRNERDRFANEDHRRGAQEEVIRDLEHRLARERRRLRDERAARGTIEREKNEGERVVAEELIRLRDSDRRWRAAVIELTREVEDWIRVNRDKERRIRELEEWFRRARLGGIR